MYLFVFTLHSLGGHFDVVRELVEAGADINHPNDTNSTPLRAASYHNRVEVIVYLLSQGADISICNNVGQAPVMISVLRENEEALRSLGKFRQFVYSELP